MSDIRFTERVRTTLLIALGGVSAEEWAKAQQARQRAEEKLDWNWTPEHVRDPYT